MKRFALFTIIGSIITLGLFSIGFGSHNSLITNKSKISDEDGTIFSTFPPLDVITKCVQLNLNQTPMEKKLSYYNEVFASEKVYLQLDKPFYKPGDDIWVAAHIRDGITHKTSEISSVVYVELIDPKGNTQKTIRLVAQKGIAEGDFKIDNDAPGGLYKIRAYTQWMKNSGEDTFFTKEFQVQASIMPKLLMKLDFMKKAYGAGDEVIANLSLNTLANKPLANTTVRFVASLQGETIIQSNTTSDENGEALIQFTLPKSLQSNDGLLNIMIQHEGSTESISRSIPIVLNNISLQFFPEGGNIVNGIEGKVGFKATDEFGKPADISGIIKNKEGKEVTTFESYHNGMGAFAFTASSDEEYKVLITKPAGIDKEYELPYVLDKAYAMGVENDGKKLKVKLYSPIEDSVSVIVQIRGQIFHSESLEANKSVQEITIPTKRMPAGVAQVTLFDYKGIQRCERLVFVNKDRQMNVQIETDKEKYLPRELVEMNITTTDEDGLPIPAALSLAVVNDQVISFADDKQDNILSYMLMSSDVKGDIHEPNFYFDDTEEKANLALDYLLMTQGWRRFTWEEVNEADIKKEPEFQAEKAVVGGTVISPKNEVMAKMKVEVAETGQSTYTDGKGNFSFTNIDLSQPKTLTVQFSSGKKRTLQINEYANDYILCDGVYGTVTDQSSGNKLENITIYIDNKKTDIKTDKNGRYTIYDLDAKAVNITFERNGYRSNAINVTNEVRLDILLSEAVFGDIMLNAAGARDLEIVEVIDFNGAEVEEMEVEALPIPAPVAVEEQVDDMGNVEEKPEVAEELEPEEDIAVADIKDAEKPQIKQAKAAPKQKARKKLMVKQDRAEIVKEEEMAKIALDEVLMWDNGNGNATVIYYNDVKYFRKREFYSPEYTTTTIDGERTDFRETVYWNPAIHTNTKGKATVSFYNSDEVTAFRATAEGFGNTGITGRTESVFYTQLPFSMSTKFPRYITFEDKVLIPITLKNNTELDITGKLIFDAPNCLSEKSTKNSNILIPANEATTVYKEYTVEAQTGDYAFSVSFEGNGEKDAFMQTFTVVPKGFPMVMSYSDNVVNSAFSFKANDIVKGSVSASLTAYPNVLSDMMSGIESILREPYGCFEQTSSSTYPNILALQYMQESGVTDPAIMKRANDLIEKGYKRLISFETKEDGYEWFGGLPAHEGLTAYGLMEFVDMKDVYASVDNSMIERTSKWLDSRKDGKGNFKLDSKALDDFGRASQEVANAYIIYALTEAGETNLETEFNKAYKTALSTKDHYQMALLANAAANMKKTKEYGNLIKTISAVVENTGYEKLTVDHTMTRSYGQSAQVETASLVLMALLKADDKNGMLIKKGAEYIMKSRSGYGGFGSTQATILALKSLTEYAKYAKQADSSGTIEVYASNQKIGTKSYEKGERNEIVIDSLGSYISEGKNVMKVAFKETKQALPYSVQVSWNTYTPTSNEECTIDVNTSLSKDKIKVGETVRLSTTIKNKSSKGQPMTIAVIGIPSGLSAQPWQLKELQEKNAFAFYEVQKNFVVFYYRNMQPNEVKEINLDLKAEIPGTYEAVASSAYLYYTNEYKDWQAGEKITIVK